jgi:TP901-1 family phage major tail protein
MAKYLGKDFILQVGDVSTATNFVTVGAMRSTSFVTATGEIDVTEKDVMPWRSLLEGGVRTREISAAGVLSNAASLVTMKAAADAGQIRYFKIVTGQGDTYVGQFQVASFERSGDYDKEEVYTLKLMNHGACTYTPA